MAEENGNAAEPGARVQQIEHPVTLRLQRRGWWRVVKPDIAPLCAVALPLCLELAIADVRGPSVPRSLLVGLFATVFLYLLARTCHGLWMASHGSTVTTDQHGVSLSDMGKHHRWTWAEVVDVEVGRAIRGEGICLAIRVHGQPAIAEVLKGLDPADLRRVQSQIRGAMAACGVVRIASALKEAGLADRVVVDYGLAPSGVRFHLDWQDGRCVLTIAGLRSWRRRLIERWTCACLLAAATLAGTTGLAAGYTTPPSLTLLLTGLTAAMVIAAIHESRRQRLGCRLIADRDGLAVAWGATQQQWRRDQIVGFAVGPLPYSDDNRPCLLVRCQNEIDGVLCGLSRPELDWIAEEVRRMWRTTERNS